MQKSESHQNVALLGQVMYSAKAKAKQLTSEDSRSWQNAIP